MFVAIPTLSCDPFIHSLFQFHHTPPHQFLWYQIVRSLPRCIFISWIPWVAADPNFNHAGHKTSILKGRSCHHPLNQTENPPCLSFILPPPHNPIHCSSKRNVFKDVTYNRTKDPYIWSCPMACTQAPLSWIHQVSESCFTTTLTQSSLPMPFKTNTFEGQAELVCSLITTTAVHTLIKMGCLADKYFFPPNSEGLALIFGKWQLVQNQIFPINGLTHIKSEKNTWTF